MHDHDLQKGFEEEQQDDEAALTYGKYYTCSNTKLNADINRPVVL
jgi:hypothetical protein